MAKQGFTDFLVDFSDLLRQADKILPSFFYNPWGN